jgi:hypothetical protein
MENKLIRPEEGAGADHLKTLRSWGNARMRPPLWQRPETRLFAYARDLHSGVPSDAAGLGSLVSAPV